jgi:hypothetical protein
VTVPNPAGGSAAVESILDLHDPYTRIYEAHYGMTPEWAQQLLGPPFSVPDGLCLSYDRTSGSCDYTLGELAGADVPHETFHFVLNNKVVKDNRIPPYGFSYDAAAERNALPVPATQYGGEGSGSTYDYFDLFTLDPPTIGDGYAADATYATIEMKYQPTSWEYIQFLYLANTQPAGSFLADEGVNLLEAWLNTGMAEPHVMASTTWGSPPVPPTPTIFTDGLATYRAGKRGQVVPSDVFKTQDNLLLEAHVADGSAPSSSGAQVFVEIRDAGGALAVSLQGFSDDTGTAQLQWKIPRQQATGGYTASVTDIVKSGYQFDPDSGVTDIAFTIQ